MRFERQDRGTGTGNETHLGERGESVDRQNYCRLGLSSTPTSASIIILAQENTCLAQHFNPLPRHLIN